MDDETNKISKILYTVLLIVICVILGVYTARFLIK